MTISIKSPKNMLHNLDVKLFLSQLMNGEYAYETSTIPAYPTIDVRNATITTKTADYTVTTSDLKEPTIFNNTGDTGAQTLSLPKVADCKGKVIAVRVTAAQVINVDPNGTEVVNLFGDAVAGKYLIIAGVIGNFAELFCDGKQWIVTKANGVVTKEA